MNLDNILGNLVASGIWFLLGYQVIALRKRLKADAEAREKMSNAFRLSFKETNPAYEQIFRQDAIVGADVILQRSRRLLSECQLYVLITFILFLQSTVYLDLFPKVILNRYICGINALFLGISVFVMFRHSFDLQSFESAILGGLNERLNLKSKALMQIVEEKKATAATPAKHNS